MKLYLAAALVAVGLTLSGVGFAWAGDGGCHDRDGCRGPAGLVWVAPTSTVATPSTTLCSVSTSSSTLAIAVGELVPGAKCTAHATLQNTGHDSISLPARRSSHLPPGCSLYAFADNLLGLAHPPSLRAGHTFAYQATVQLGTSAGNACAGTSAAWTVTIGGSGGCGCGGGWDVGDRC